MSWTLFEQDIQETVNEAAGTLSEGLVRRKIQAALRKIEGLWNFPYMFEDTLAEAAISNAPINTYSVQWKALKKVGLWGTTTIDSDMSSHGGGSTEFIKFLQRIEADDLRANHFETLNVQDSWDVPVNYQIQRAGFVLYPLTGERVFRTQIQLYPPPSSVYKLSLQGYAYTIPYTEDDLENDHWMLNYGRDLLEAWTILSLTPALQDATLAKFFADLVPDAQEVLLKSEANSDWEGLDETAEYLGESDI